MSKAPLTEILRAIGITLGLVLSALMVPLAGQAALFVLTAPVLYAAAVRGIVAGTAAAAAIAALAAAAGAAGAIGTAGDPGPVALIAGIAVFSYFMLSGVLPAAALRRGWPIRRLIPLSAAGATATLAIAGVLTWLLFRFNLWSASVAVLREAVVTSGRLIKATLSSDAAKTLAPIIEQTIETAPALLPGIVGFIIVISAAASIVTAIWFLRRRGADVPGKVPFERMRIPWYWSWGMVAALGAQMAPAAFPLPAAQGRMIAALGGSLLFIFGPFYFLQGLAIVGSLLSRWKSSTALKIYAYGLIGLIPLLSEIAVLLGLLETWFDLRKLDKVPEADEEEPDEAAPPDRSHVEAAREDKD